MGETDSVPSKKPSEIESKLKKAMGNVLPASGGQDTSLISSDPFKYSQLGLMTSNSLNDALSKVQDDIQHTLSNFQLDTGSLFWKSIGDEIKNQQEKLIEQTKVSINEELKKVADEIVNKSSILGQPDIRNQIENQQRKMIEQAKVSITEELKKVADKIEKEHPIRLTDQNFRSVWNTLGEQGIRDQIEDKQRKLLEEVGRSLGKGLQEVSKKNLKLDKDRSIYSPKD